MPPCQAHVGTGACGELPRPKCCKGAHRMSEGKKPNWGRGRRRRAIGLHLPGMRDHHHWDRGNRSLGVLVGGPE